MQMSGNVYRVSQKPETRAREGKAFQKEVNSPVNKCLHFFFLTVFEICRFAMQTFSNRGTTPHPPPPPLTFSF